LTSIQNYSVRFNLGEKPGVPLPTNVSTSANQQKASQPNPRPIPQLQSFDANPSAQSTPLAAQSIPLAAQSIPLVLYLVQKSSPWSVIWTVITQKGGKNPPRQIGSKRPGICVQTVLPQSCSEPTSPPILEGFDEIGRKL